jgi:hypothetical protein
MLLAVLFNTVQVSASNGQVSGRDLPVVLKKTPEPKTPPGLEKKATKEAEKELRASVKATQQADKLAERLEKKAGKKVHFRGVVSEVGASSFVLDVGGTLITFMVNNETQIKIPTLGKSADLSMLNVGVKASVQAVEMVAEPPAEGEAVVQQEELTTEYLALMVQVIPGKPVRIHRVGVVVNYQPGVSITIQAKDMQLYTFLLTETTKILPLERQADLQVGVWVTIISRRDPTGGPLTAQGIVIHPKAEEDVTEPTDITLAPASVNEGLPVGTVVGTFTTTDATVGDTFTYTLITGTGDTDNAVFSISGDQLLTAAVFDFETKSSYSIRVQTTDQNGSFFEKAIVITVNDVAGDPADIALSTATVAENAPLSTEVGVFSTTNTDLTDVHTYTLVVGDGDDDNASFTISGDKLVTAALFDFETKNSYTIRVRSTDDDGFWFEKVFVITVTDVVE